MVDLGDPSEVVREKRESVCVKGRETRERRKRSSAGLRTGGLTGGPHEGVWRLGKSPASCVPGQVAYRPAL